MALARRATLGHPDDGLAWLTLADALRDSAESWQECIQAYRKATELLPDNATALNNLARMMLKKGKAEEALPLAVAAVRLAPWESAFLDTLATALAGVGRCSEAVGAQARALDNLPERVEASVRTQYAKTLAALQKQCSDRQAASASAASPDAGPTR